MNSNKDFTGFTPDELVEELKAKTEDPFDIEEYNESLSKPLESPENGQLKPGSIIEVNETTLKPATHKKWGTIKHKKKKSIAESLPQSSAAYGYDKQLVPNLKAPSIADPTAGYSYHYDYVKLDDIVTEGTPANSIAVTSTPSTVAMASGTPYSTYIMGKDAVWGYGIDWSGSQTQAYQKEIAWLQSQVVEAKAVIAQLSGEPGEFIYIHPFDLYELLNSFVIPVVMNVNEEFSDRGYIEINGKKYKQSTLMPIVSKNSCVDASKYSPDAIPGNEFHPPIDESNKQFYPEFLEKAKTNMGKW